MKTMIKTCFIAVAILLGVNVNAQDKPLEFGVKAGVNLSTFSGDNEGAKAKVGFNAGVTVDYAITPEVYLLSGLEYSLKGAKVDGVDVKLNMSYLQLPIHIGYKLAIAENTKVVFRGGPYVAYAIDGKWKVGGISIDAFGDEIKTADVDGTSKLKRFDFGLGIGAGLEFGKFGVGLGWDFGLVKVNDSDGGSLKNMNGYLSVGYRF